MKKSILLSIALLCNCIFINAVNTVVVNNVTIPQGGTGSISVELNNDKTYTAFSMKLTLPDGINFVSVTKGDRMVDSHSLSGNAATGVITCLSTANDVFSGTSGELFTINISADTEAVVDDVLSAFLTEVTFATTSGEETLSNVAFNITIGEPDDGRIKFNETATKLPTYTAGEKGDVSMVRSIKANSWSTIVLPFTLTKAKAETIFGSDVQLAEFTGFEVDYGDDEENVVPLGITINFSIYTMGAKKSMTGGKPFLIKTSMDITDFTADDVTLFDAITDVVKADEFETAGKFTGAFTKTVVPADGLFINNEKFYYSTGKTAIKAFRGWFELDAVLDKETDFGVKMFIDGFETKVEGVSVRDASGTIYDLSGRRVSRPQKSGVYIVNGKKAVLR